MTSPPSRRRGSGAQASLLGSIFLAPPSSLYASIDNDDHVVAGPSSSQLPFHSPHARHPHHAQDPFLLQPSDMDKSVAPSSPPTSPPRTQRHSHHGGGARSMLAQLNPNRNFGALQDDIFEEEEEDAQGGSGGGTPRGRQPSQSIMQQQPQGETIFHRPGSRTVTPSPTRGSRSSHSRSPPPDLTHHVSTPLLQSPNSTTGFQIEGLHLGGESASSGATGAAASVLRSLLKGVKSLLGHSTRSGGGLDRRQRALWLWVNVDDLDAFLSDVYSYYAGKGLYCIALAKALSLMSVPTIQVCHRSRPLIGRFYRTIGFVIAFSTFLLRCVDYSTIRSKHRLQDALVDKCVAGHPLTLVLVTLASIVYMLQIVGFSRTLKHLTNMHAFFEELLEIPDSDIQTVPWDHIVNRLSNLRAEHPSAPSLLQAQPEDGPVNPLKLDAHDVANRVMREENYMVALFNRDVLDLSIPWPRPLIAAVPALDNFGKGELTKVLEWNIRKGLLQYLFGPGAKVRKAFLDTSNRDVLIEGMQRRLVLLGWLNAAFAPFIVLYVLLYSFFRYFEEYHKNPSSIGSRKFTNMARWRFREYNELPHVFENRLHMAHPLAETYLDQFPKAKTAMVARFVAFIAGAFASVLVLFSLLDPDAFLHFEVTKDRSVLFYIGLFGGVLAMARGMVPEEHSIVDPEKVMQEIASYTHYMPEGWSGHLHSHKVHAEFSSLFQMKISTFFIEVLSVITTPFVLWYTLPACAPNIIDFFREFTVHVDGLGYVCSFGVFDFKRPGQLSQKDASARVAGFESKVDQSMLNFARIHPAWVPRDQSTSIYLSQMQNHPALRPTKFNAGPPGLASTTLINEEQLAARDAELRAAQYEAAFHRAGGSSKSNAGGSTRQAPQDHRVVEEDGLGESYDDGSVARQQSGEAIDSEQGSPRSDPPTTPSLVGMLMDQGANGQRHQPW